MYVTIGWKSIQWKQPDSLRVIGHTFKQITGNMVDACVLICLSN